MSSLSLVMPSKTKRPLDVEEQQFLAIALAEMQSRGISIPRVDSEKEEPDWPLDSRGFFLKSDGTHYKPTAMQLACYESNARFIAYVGGRGSGKSCTGAQKALRKIMEGKNGAVLSPDFQHFLVSTWPELRDWLPWDMVVPSQRHRANPEWEPQKPFSMVFLNGARMICKGLRDPDSARGPNINWLWYDEAGRDEDGLAWKLAIAGVRVGDDPQAWITTTPRGKEHWIYRFFIEKDLPQEVYDAFKERSGDRELIAVFTGSIEDNKNNLDPGFYASLLAMYPIGWLRAQELDGLFVDEGGVLGNAAWLQTHMVQEPPEMVKLRVRYWDLAASEKKVARGDKKDDPDDTVGTLLSWDGKEKFCIEHQVGGQWPWEKIKQMIILTAQMDGPYVPIYVEQEPGAGGKNQVAAVAEIPELKNYIVRPHLPAGDKVMRANIWFAEAARGLFTLVSGPWNQKLLYQLSSFPLARHDDYIDSVSGARLVIAPIRQWRKVEFLAI